MSSIRSSGAFITYQGKYLLMLRDDYPHILNPNTWSILGGIEEDGETPSECLVREIKEEGNITVTEHRLLFEHPSGEIVFHIELSSTQFKDLALGDEGQQLKFFSFEEMLELNLSTTVKAYLIENNDLIKALAHSARGDSFVIPAKAGIQLIEKGMDPGSSPG